MKCFKLYSLCLSLMVGCVQVSLAQVTGSKPTIATPEEDFYDVRYVKLALQATNLSTAITGHTTTVATVSVASMGLYAFELSGQLTIDSVKVDGNLLPVQSMDSIRKVNLSNPILQNVPFTAEVWYHGQPTGGSNFFTNGLLNQTDGSIPVQVTHTVSAALHSRDWWACKQSLTDKIDSADIWITVPTGLKVASNGLLQNVSAVSASENRYEWSLRSPADYYLLSFAVAPYDEYNYQMHFTNGDSMLIQNFIYNHPSVLQNHKDELDSIENLINHYSTIFGRYPYDKEKFGICQTPLSGGMENQTMVSLGSLDISLIAHELSHQWWGDNVTCGSLTDMWLNEGWATYSEHLFLEHFHGSQAALTFRNQTFNASMAGTGGSVFVDDTTDELRIYDSRLTYSKGAALAHMLRYVIHDDAVFFQLLQDYQQQYKNATATTEDIKNLAMTLSGVPLDTFFQQWYKGEGYPIYSAKWYQNGAGNVIVKLTQATSMPSSVPLFKTPVDIRLNSAQGDTIIRVLNTQAIELYNFNWSKTMTGMTIDPNNHILNKVSGLIVNDPTLSSGGVSKKSIQIYPNPSTTGWNIINIPPRSSLTLTDVSGKVIWNSTITEDSIIVPSASLAPGTYILQVKVNKNPMVNYYLSR